MTDNNLVTKLEVLDNLPQLATSSVPARVEELSPTTGIAPVKPSWMQVDEEAEVQNKVRDFVDVIITNPNDVKLSVAIYKLGEDGANALIPHVSLYDKKAQAIMRNVKEGSPQNLTILQLKQQMDMVNPAVLSSLPITTKAFIFFSRSKLPKAQEVLDMIYERRETVATAVKGIKQNLWQQKEGFFQDLSDLSVIYQGLLQGQRLIERDIYFAQLLYGEVGKIFADCQDPIAKQNLERLSADIMTQVINLQTEENANLQFFAGSQAIARLTTQQIQNMSGLARLLETTVLANLGLRVVAVELERSVQMTEQLKKTIGNTIADTGKLINETGDQITKARSQAVINLQGLEEGCKQLEDFFMKQAEANAKIIEEGAKTSSALTAMSERLRKRVEGGHDTVKVLAERS